jgi:hypothetical protein
MSQLLALQRLRKLLEAEREELRNKVSGGIANSNEYFKAVGRIYQIGLTLKEHLPEVERIARDAE